MELGVISNLFCFNAFATIVTEGPAAFQAAEEIFRTEGPTVELLRELTDLQHEHGCVSDAVLCDLARRRNVPLYRLEGLVSFYPVFRRTPGPQTRVRVCRDVACVLGRSAECAERVRRELGNRSDVEIVESSCLGRCDSAPAATINEVPVLLADHDACLNAIDAPHNHSVATSSDAGTWKIDPYGSADEHYATARELIAGSEDLSETCITRLTESKLSGLGGAGFPAGLKWKLVAAEAEATKYVICNADESEPGTFKDREILAQLPYLVIEGMLLAGLTVGAERGIVYIRHEYERERRVLQAAIDKARELGVLGSNAAGSGRAFDVEVFVSPGGYILGEETALLEALEDKRGEPRNKPPYPGSVGLHGKPTLINNVETFAAATSIIHHGPQWWHDQGLGEASGLKFVCVSGDVNRPGVYEIPLGLTVAELIERAGGMRDDKPLLAFLPGGASSKFLTATHAETPLEIDAVRDAGSMLGTGAVIVIAEGRDLFALATNLVRFFRNESCGKCVPCRTGTEKAVRLLEAVQNGSADSTCLEVLPDLADTLEQTSICGLGQVALNPILSMLEHFPEQVPSSS